MSRIKIAILSAAALIGAPLQLLATTCFELASQRYSVPKTLLIAIAEQESGMRADAVNRANRDGSRDIGLMQINSGWLPTLARHGIMEKDLFDPCVNTLVGAWILRGNFQRLGYTVNALGAYNARDPVKRLKYANAVLRRTGSARMAANMLAGR